jgi:hypothetical protein
MSALVGSPSDDLPDVLAFDGCRITDIFVSMCARHPEGKDAEYLRWHTFDHRPEQFRVPEIRATMRLVSTPECRAGRARSEPPYDEVDHVMSYFFADMSGMRGFNDLSAALRAGGRTPYLLPLAERGIFTVEGGVASPDIKVGADVLPWLPIRGAYLLVERGTAPPSALVEVDGVAGVWWGASREYEPDFSTADGRPMSSADRVQITYCFLEDDPVAVAGRLSAILEDRWSEGGPEPLLAAPFHAVTGYDFDHHLP